MSTLQILSYIMSLSQLTSQSIVGALFSIELFLLQTNSNTKLRRTAQYLGLDSLELYWISTTPQSIVIILQGERCCFCEGRCDQIILRQMQPTILNHKLFFIFKYSTSLPLPPGLNHHHHQCIQWRELQLLINGS